MKKPLTLLNADLARLMLASVATPVAPETVPLGAALGRVSAARVVSAESLPAQPRSAMDGYAVRSEDIAAATEADPCALVLVGAVPMGGVLGRAVGRGEAVSIPTGGVLPTGADTVVMIEDTATEGARVQVRRSGPAGRHVLPTGDDIAVGAEILRAGRRLGPQHLAGLAAVGVGQVSVFRRPRVAVLSTGNELCTPNEVPRPGQVRDSNQGMLAAQIARAGCEVGRRVRAPDDPSALQAALRELAAGHDMVLLSGGSSIGGADFTGEIFERLGKVLFHGLAVRPGKPTVAAQASNCLLIGLPGVPAAAFIIFEVYVRPLLRLLAGEPGPWPAARTIPVRMAKAVVSAPGREDYLRVRLEDRDGDTFAEPLAVGSSGLSALILADGIAIIPIEAASLAAGDRVEVMPFSA